MQSNIHSDISNFFIAGINYKKTDAAIRGNFAINSNQYSRLLSIAKENSINEFFILSTCNRTEIYGLAPTVNHLINLLCAETEGSKETFLELSYLKQGEAAIEHLFEVAAGLDSQILGDYEIVGQIKQAVKFSKEKGFIGAFLERLVNSVLQSSKKIKNYTHLSGGTISVAFAAVQYIKENITNYSEKNILLLGVGKIGRNVCKNMVDYLQTKNITLINRTENKATELANELGLKSAPLHELAAHIADSDIILVATNSTEPAILKEHLENRGSKIILDLSVPYNVEEAAQCLPNVSLLNVDELSKMKDETLQKRLSAVPKAKEIIEEHIGEFIEWHHMRRHVPALKAVKTKLQQMHNCPLYADASLPYSHRTFSAEKNEQKVQKVITMMAVKLRKQNYFGCHYIDAINDYMAISTK